MLRAFFILVLSSLMVFDATMSLAQTNQRKTPPTDRVGERGRVKLITLAPGHFHAALVQKVMYPDVSPTVSIYAPAGPDLALPDYSNGELSYRLKGIHARVSVIWNFAAPPEVSGVSGAGDTHFSIMRGTKANVIIQQGSAENYRPELYVEAGDLKRGKRRGGQPALEAALQKAVKRLQAVYPGLELRRDASRWHIRIPDQHRTDHEAHFGQVMEKFLTFLKEGKLPSWEAPNMIAKYYTTIKALELAQTCKANC